MSDLKKVLDKLTAMEEKFEKRFDDLDEKLTGLTNRMEMAEKRINILEEKTKKLSLLENKYRVAIGRTKAAGVVAEFKSRELNAILNNIPQEDTVERNSKSFELAQDFIKNVLGIHEPIALTHAHRLPTGGTSSRRPLIIKLKDMVEKEKLWANVKMIEAYNKDKDGTDKRYVEMVHLPKKLFIDKMSLKDNYKKARNAGKNLVGSLIPKTANTVIK